MSSDTVPSTPVSSPSVADASAALAREHRNLLAVLDATPVGMLVFDPDESILFANPAAERLLDADQDTLQGLSCGDALQCVNRTDGSRGCGHGAACPDCPLRTAVQDALAGRASVQGLPHEAVVERRDAPLWLRYEARPIAWDDRPCALLALDDITERKHIEDQLRAAQKLEAVGQLAGGIAHDFNNHLQSILGHTEMALINTGDTDAVREDLEELRRAAHRSAALTRQLLAFSRRQTVRPRPVDLNEAIERLLRMLRRLIGEDIDLAWQPSAGLWQVFIDPSQIDQVLANLVVNARDAIDGAGRVTIATANVDLSAEDGARHLEASPGAWVRLAVADTGAGIDDKTLARIFEPFFTTRGVGRGTGLGLATVHGIVKQHEGWIDVRSRPGAGTVFHIYLPRCEQAAAGDDAHGADDPAREHPSGAETVMVVEDEPSILELARRVLAGSGYRVLASSDPKKALRLAETHLGPIDLLLSDIIMPGMNGRELACHIAARHSETRVIYMSGYTANVIAHRHLLEPGITYLQKPFTTRELTHLVRRVLDAPIAPVY